MLSHQSTTSLIESMQLVLYNLLDVFMYMAYIFKKVK